MILGITEPGGQRILFATHFQLDVKEVFQITVTAVSLCGPLKDSFVFSH